MCVNVEDLCEYKGQTYIVRFPGRMIGDRMWWTPPTDVRNDLLSLVPKGKGVSSACWRGCIGLFALDGGRLLLRALSAFMPDGEIPQCPDWVARQGAARWVGWEKAGPYSDEFVEYSFSRPHEVPYSRLRLYAHYYDKHVDYVHEVAALGTTSCTK